MVEDTRDHQQGSDLFQEQLDELFLLETRANQRIDRLEAHYAKRSEELRVQDQSLKDLVSRQQQLSQALTKKCDEVYGWYRGVLKIGSVLVGIILLGLAVIFLWWWHVSEVSQHNDDIQEAIDAELHDLPLITFKDHHTYIRIVPDAFVPALKDDHDRAVEGIYARVYFKGEN